MISFGELQKLYLVWPWSVSTPFLCLQCKGACLSKWILRMVLAVALVLRVSPKLDRSLGQTKLDINSILFVDWGQEKIWGWRIKDKSLTAVWKLLSLLMLIMSCYIQCRTGCLWYYLFRLFQNNIASLQLASLSRNQTLTVLAYPAIIHIEILGLVWYIGWCTHYQHSCLRSDQHLPGLDSASLNGY